MTSPIRVLSISVAAVVFSTALGSSAAAQQVITKKPTAAEWAALANLPDFNGVWERGGGGAPRGNAAPAAPAAAPRGAAPAAAAPQGGAAGRGGAGGRGGGGRGGGAQLTPEYEAKR